jgi:hypothetical protein
MKTFQALIFGVFFIGVAGAQANDFLLVCANSTNKCDDNSLYKTCDGDLYGKTFFSFRPQDSDSSRRILTWFNADYVPKVHSTQDDTCSWPKTGGYQKMRYMFAISPQYTRSFDPNDIAQWFFFNGCDEMTVGIPNEYETFDIDGSQIGLSLGTSYDIETDSLFLTPGKIGSVWAKPFVENYIIDLDFWYDLSSWHDNLWSRLECPIVYMKTNMMMCATGRGNQAEDYPNGLFSLDSTPDELDNIICNTTPVPYSSILCALEGNQGWGAVEPLQAGKFPMHALSKWGVAGLHFDLGYDIYKTAPWYCAGSLHVVFPTGTRPKGTYVFEPVIGANKSWQIGATFIANYVRECEHGDCGIYLYAVGTHLFKSSQQRVFSLKANGPGSQLLLLKQFNSIGSELVSAPREANIFCGKAKIGASLMFDGSVMFQYSHKSFVMDLGYNLWVRTKERRSKEVCFREYADNGYGIKGSEPMEIISTTGGDYAPLICNSDFSTDSTATIVSSGATDAQPVFIQPDDVNYGSALAPTCISNKIFAAAGYKSNWFVLLSGEAEFGTNNAAITQYGVMLKVGVEF